MRAVKTARRKYLKSYQSIILHPGSQFSADAEHFTGQNRYGSFLLPGHAHCIWGLAAVTLQKKLAYNLFGYPVRCEGNDYDRQFYRFEPFPTSRFLSAVDYLNNTLQVLPQYRRVPEGFTTVSARPRRLGRKKSHTVRLLSNVRERSSHAITSLEPQPKPKSSPPLLLRRSSERVCVPPNYPAECLTNPEPQGSLRRAPGSCRINQSAGVAVRISEAGRAPRGLGIVFQVLLMKDADCLSEDRAEWQISIFSIADCGQSCLCA